MSASPIRVRGIAELIATLPMQMGYRPEDSLMLVLLGAPEQDATAARPAGAVQQLCRIDLPHDAGGYEEMLAAVDTVLRRQASVVAEVVAFEESTDSTEVLHAVVRLCRNQGLEVHHAVRVREDRWLDVLGDEQAAEWGLVPQVVDVPAAADLALHGAAEGPGRSELARRITEGDEARRTEVYAEVLAYLDRLHEATVSGEGPAPWPRFVERGARAWRRILDDTPGGPAVQDLAPALLAQAVTMLGDREFRDGLILWLAPGTLGPGMLSVGCAEAFVRQLPMSRWGGPGSLDRLVHLCALVPDDFAAPVLTVTAQVAWARNSGTIANLAIERALEVDPGYYLARLTDTLLQRAVPPPVGPFGAVA